MISYGYYLGFNAKPWQTVEQDSHDQQHALGAFFDDEFGRRFRYALNGAGALVAGDIVQSAALGGAATTLQTAAFVGAASVVTDLRIYAAAITTLQAAGLFAEGWAAFWDSSLLAAYTRRVKNNSELEHTTWVDGWIDLYEPLPVALTTDDKIALMTNPYKSIVQAVVANATGLVLGGVRCAVPITHYCWVQTRGWFGVHIKEGNLAIGQLSVPKATTAGTLSAHDEDDVNQIVANTGAAWADEVAGLVYLTCE